MNTDTSLIECQMMEMEIIDAIFPLWMFLPTFKFGHLINILMPSQLYPLGKGKRDLLNDMYLKLCSIKATSQNKRPL